MNADHIFVVMNGEILESGSHQTLTSAKGKYYDLWSKQLFLKPETDRSRPQSPMKRGAATTDELTRCHDESEVAQTSTILEEPGDPYVGPNPDGDIKNNGKGTGSSHQQEVSSTAS